MLCVLLSVGGLLSLCRHVNSFSIHSSKPSVAAAVHLGRQRKLTVSYTSSSSSCCASAVGLFATSSTGTPIDPSGWPLKFPAKDHCSRCGLCETSFVSTVKEACALLPQTGMSRMHTLEQAVHGKSRDMSSASFLTAPSETAEEGRFGVLYEPMKLAKGVGVPGAQWTGVVTGIALSMLEAGEVDAVVCIASSINSDDNSSSWSSPEPILARTVADVLKGRGVKPSLAPSLRVLDEIQADDSIRNLLFCGVGCAVQAFRAIQDKLNLQNVYVLGTNCVDNSPTPQAADNFLRQGVQIEDSLTVQGYEFMQDFKVHVKATDSKGHESYIKKPYFSLPGTIAAPSIATSCLACFDYTNGLADVVVGYMGAPLGKNKSGQEERMDQAWQTLTIRNARGAHMVATTVKAGRLEVGEIAVGQGKHEKQAMATVQADSIVQAMVGGNIPDKGLPLWFAEILAFVLRSTGPKGVHFARYSIDYHILRNYLHVVKEWGKSGVEQMIPAYAKAIVEHYLETGSGMRALLEKVQNISKEQADQTK